MECCSHEVYTPDWIKKKKIIIIIIIIRDLFLLNVPDSYEDSVKGPMVRKTANTKKG